MFGVVADLLLHKQLKLEKGRVTLFNIRGSMLPLSVYVNAQRILEKEGMENALYYGAKETGRLWNENMQKQYKAKTPTQIFEWGNKVMNLAGFGEFRVHKEDLDKKELTYRLYDSQLAAEYEKSKYPVCQIPRGLFAGSACFVTRADLDAVETRCLSCGDPFCEFEIKSRKKFDMKNQLVKRQLKEVDAKNDE